VAIGEEGGKKEKRGRERGKTKKEMSINFYKYYRCCFVGGYPPFPPSLSVELTTYFTIKM